MPLWDRFTRMVKANVGRILDDPLDKSGAGRKLDQRLKELRARDTELKQLDEKIITLKGHATFLERKLEKLKRKEAEQDARARAATAHGAGMTATNHEIDLSDTRREIAQVEAELVGARTGLERAEVQKRALVEEKATRLAAAQEALLEAEHESQQGAPPAPLARSPLPGGGPPEPAPPVGPEPTSGAPRIKITPRGAPDEAPRKTIGPEAGRDPTAEPAASASASSSSLQKTLGPGAEAASPSPDASGSSSGRSTKSLGPATPAPAPPPAASSSAAAAPPGGDRLLDELERLGKLLEAGAISAEEFAAAKKKLLGA